MNIKVEGEPSKRWLVVWWGESVGDWDSAKEALDGYSRHNKEIRPIIIKGNRKAQKDKPRYQFFDGRKEITLVELRRAAAEQAS